MSASHEGIMARLGFQCQPEVEPSTYMFEDNPACLQDLECLKRHLTYSKYYYDDKPERMLSYRSFQELRRSGKLSDTMAKALLDAEMSAPDYKRSGILFTVPETPVRWEDYSINSLWIHRDKVEHDIGHLFGTDDEKLREYVLKPLCDWRQKQPKATINFWYDSATQAGPKQVKETRRILNDDLHLNVQLRDIRTIPFVRDHPEMMALSLPVYYRVDLSKALILDHVITHDKKLYAVVSDADVVAVVKDQLFDAYTVDYLNNFGYIFGTCVHGGADQENSFMIMKNDEPSGPFTEQRYVELQPMNTPDRHKKQIIDKAELHFRLDHGHPDQQHIFSLYNAFKTVLKLIQRQLHPQRTASGKTMGIPDSRFAAVKGLCPVSNLDRVRKHVARVEDVQ